MNEATTVPEAVSAEGTESSGDGTGAPPSRRRRGGRGRSKPAGTRESGESTETIEAAPVEEGAPDAPSEAPARPRTRQRTRKEPVTAPKKAETERTAKPRAPRAAKTRPEK